MTATIIGVDGAATNLKGVPGLKGIKPTGTRVLVEIIVGEELRPTTLTLPEGSEIADGAPQGYVLGIGSQLQTPGFEVGDRVILHGNYTPLPEGKTIERENSHRPLILVEQHQIKAVLEEE